MADDLEAMMVDARTLARFLGLSRQRINQLTDDGTLRRGEGGKYALADSTRRYATNLRDRPTQSAADVKIREARAKEIEVRTAERLRELIQLDDALDTVSEILGPHMADLDSVGSHVGRGFPYPSAAALRAEVEKWIADARNAAADRAERKAEELRTGKKAA